MLDEHLLLPLLECLLFPSQFVLVGFCVVTKDLKVSLSIKTTTTKKSSPKLTLNVVYDAKNYMSSKSVCVVGGP